MGDEYVLPDGSIVTLGPSDPIPPGAVPVGGGSGGGGETTNKIQVIDGVPYIFDGSRLTPAPGFQPSTQQPTVRNLGNDVFEDETGVYILEPVQGYMGTDVPAEPQKRYLTQAEQKQLLNPDTGTGSGGSAGNPLGWANLAENQRQYDLDRQYEMQSSEAEARRWLTEYTMGSQALMRQEALEQQQFDWLKQKESLAIQQGNQQLALQAQAQADQRANAMAQIRLRQEELSFQYQQATMQAEAQRRRDLSDVNAQIGVLGQDTGNRGRFAAFATANRGFGQENAAIGRGASLIDDTSAQPLEAALQEQQRLQQPTQPFGGQPWAQQQGISFGESGYSPEQAAEIQARINQQFTNQVGAAAQHGAQTINFNPADEANLKAAGITTLSDLAAGFGQGGDTVQGRMGDGNFTLSPTNPLPRMEQGGLVRGAFMAGDSTDGKENEEIIIPMGEFTAVASTKGMAPEKVKALKQRLAKFATGGLFDNLTGSPLSKQFLTDASAKFRQGTPWEGQAGALPSPVYASSPGFNPLLAQMLNSGRALEQGVPEQYSAWLTDRYRPAAMQQSGIGRSR